MPDDSSSRYSCNAICFLSSGLNSRNISKAGVRSTLKSLDASGWMPSNNIAAKLVNRKWLLDHGYKEEKIKEQDDFLKEDLNSGLLEKAKPTATQLEKDLLDPKKDVYVVCFDGQHRSEARSCASHHQRE